MSYTDGLTDQQREAVLHTDGPLLILAGAGSGKTRTVTRRIARLVADGVDPTSILAITFTNKAAGEMRERVAELLGVRPVINPQKRRKGRAKKEVAPQPTVATFHAFAVRLLREYAGRLGWGRGFAILDPGEQLGLVREAAVSARVDLKRFKTHDLAHMIGRAKERLDDKAFTKSALSELERAAALTLPHYRKLQRKRGGLDFEDLVAEAVRLLEDDAEARDEILGRLHYVLVDEYQDTNHSQYRLACALAGERRNLAVCGDPDQSIYGWRGADMGNILRFEEDFPGAKVVLLEHNYRSTATILNASNHLIRHNSARKEKQLLPTGKDGALIDVVPCLDAELEATHVAREIVKVLDEGVLPGEIAIVFRAAIHARAYEDALVQREVPCAMSGSTSFFERAAVKDALAWVRLALNEKDDLATLRAIRAVGGVGKRTIDKLHEAQRNQRISLLEACRRADRIDGITAPTRQRLANFAAKITQLQREGQRGIEELVAAAIDLMPESPPDEAERRNDDLGRLLKAARAAQSNERRTPGEQARNFLDRLSLLDAQDRGDNRNDRVTLTTVHSSKGLEFRVVFVVGLEDGLFPHYRSLAEGTEEEERRLAYVAFTRAKEQLVLTYAISRKGQDRQPSRFLYELPPELLWDPILKEPMVLPERASEDPQGPAYAHRRKRSKKDKSSSPALPSLATRGLRRKGGLRKPPAAKPAATNAQPKSSAPSAPATSASAKPAKPAKPRWSRGLQRSKP